MNVLVVDDEPDVRILFEMQFRREIRAGKIVFHFALSGPEALFLLASQAEDLLILSDINMPGMSGLELLKVVKAKYPHLKVVMITAYGDDFQAKAVEYGCDDYLTKPLDFALLKAQLLV